MLYIGFLAKRLAALMHVATRVSAQADVHAKRQS